MLREGDFTGARHVPTAVVRLVAFPVVVLVAAIALGLSTVTTSSIGLFADGAPEGLLAGPDRPIRSDEWYVRTTWVARQAALNFPSSAPGGMGIHDVAVLGDLPTRSWEVVLRPQTLGYFVFGLERAFSLEQWTLVAIQLLGVYALVAVLSRRPWLAAAAALLTTFSPAMQWWATPTGFLTIGCGSFATALVVLAARGGRTRHRLVLALLAGWALSVFGATLYVPWQIGAALVLAPIALGAAARDVLTRPPMERRLAIRGLVVAAGVTGVVAAILFGAFVVRHHHTFDAIAQTVYPGQRVASGGGTANPRVFWGSAFDLFSSSKASAIVNGENQSENGSGLPLLVPAAAGCVALAATKRLRTPALPLVGAVVAGAVLAAWMLLPIPASIGQLLLLQRVQPRRLFLPIAFAGVLAMVLLVAYLLDGRIRLARWQTAACAVVFALPQAWCASRYTVDGSSIDIVLGGAIVALTTVAIVLALSRWPAVGLAMLVVLVAVQTWSIQPLQRGMDPLVANPLYVAVSQVRASIPDQRAGWVAFDTAPEVKGTLTAAGVNHLSGVSPYPDLRAWHVLDPLGAHERIWNRYAHVAFSRGPQPEPTFELLGVDSVNVIIDPCSPVLEDLGVRYFVTAAVAVGPCAATIAHVTYRGTDILVSERVTR